MTHYDQGFYNDQFHGSLKSAEQVVPIVMSMYSPKTVIDIGCGAGTWAHVFERDFSCDVMGVDGDYVPREMILIDNYIPHNLENRVEIGKKFDLAVCLEVAEHLTPERSRSFINDLVRLSDRILFSAAIPGQGGTNHINEQPFSFWAGIFAGQGYRADEEIRTTIAGNEEVAWWYRQNIVVFERS
jgi:cyclopropane fatty-acyl-phospholipid synthase-like methyltransferase